MQDNESIKPVCYGDSIWLQIYPAYIMGVKLTKHVVHQCKKNQIPTTVGKPTLYPFKLDAKSAAKFTIKRPIGAEPDEFVKHLDEVTIEQDWFYLSCEDGDAVYRENSGPDLDAHFVQDPLGVLIIHSCTKETNRGRNKFERVFFLLFLLFIFI